MPTQQRGQETQIAAMQLESDTAQTAVSAASIALTPSDAAAALPSPQAAAISDRAAAIDAAAVGASAGSKRKGADRDSASSASPSAGSKQLSSSAAVAYTSSSHPAPEEDSTAAEPDSKRARPTPLTATHSSDSPMLQLLGRDSGARQSLMEMLPVADLASLLCSARSCHAWIQALPSPSVFGQIKISANAINSFEQCRWIQQSLQSLYVRGDDASEAQIDQLLGCLSLPQLARLRSLDLRCSIAPDTRLLRESLRSVASKLQHFGLYLAAGQDDAWPAVQVLTGLVSLHVGAFANFGAADFSFLPTMKRLQRFHVQLGRSVACTPNQVEALSQCTTLTGSQLR